MDLLPNKPTDKQLNLFTHLLKTTEELKSFVSNLPKHSKSHTNEIVDFSLQILEEKLFAKLTRQEMSYLISDVYDGHYNQIINTLKKIYK